MNFRTDLALERQEILKPAQHKGVSVKAWQRENTKVTEIVIENSEGEKTIGKPIGKYITVELPEFSHESELLDARLTALSEAIRSLLPEGNGTVLVAGLGNESITPDAIGPKAAKRIFSTRHIGKELSEQLGFPNLRPVACIAPGVLGQTGVETGEILKGVAQCTDLCAIITIDALASRRLSRLGRTVQLSDTGITPGSGVGNARAEISRNTMGVPVIAVGVPTVVDALTLANEITDGKAEESRVKKEAAAMMVTPKEIDVVTERAAKLVALAVNCALQPQIEPEVLLSVV